MCAVLNVAVLCSSLVSCFPCVLLGYCLSDFEMVPVITGLTLNFTFHMHFIASVTLYFNIFPVSSLITFTSHETETSIIRDIHFSLS